MYNVEKWISTGIKSLKQQTESFKCLLIDDISTDNTVQIVKQKIEGDSRFELWERKEKSYALKNIVEGIKKINPSDDDIIVTIDGDDWLASETTLARVKQEYEEQDCLMTYGNYIKYPHGIKPWNISVYPDKVIQEGSYRQDPQWRASHLRTFKYRLWNKIQDEDLRAPDNSYYRMAWDLAFMFPMLEMAREKARFIPDVLYVYNESNPINDHKVDHSLQLALDKQIRNKTSYEQIEKSKQTEFWCDALKLLTPLRFDILFKYIYAKLLYKGINEKWVDEIYGHHLKVWNGLNELKPAKAGIDNYKSEFHKILESIKEKGFDKKTSYIPFHTKSQSPLNGAHRIAASIFFNKSVYCKHSPEIEGQLCSYYYLANRNTHVPGGLSKEHSDLAALEYCRLKKNTFVVTLFPAAKGQDDIVRGILSKKAGLIYEKSFKLTNQGAFNFIRFLYDEDASRGNPWMGNWHNNFAGARSKVSCCFTNPSPIRVFLIETENVDDCRALKEEIRDLYGIGNHSVHINDTYSETLKTAGHVFNDNSIHFLNNCKPNLMPNFQRFVEILIRWISSSGVDPENVCVDSSAVLSAYGLRDCRDLDFLYHEDFINTGLLDVSCHNEEMKYYTHKKDDIIFNPRNHFYYQGLKFASLDVILAMKNNRNEEKDVIDVELIKSLISNNETRNL